MKTVLFACVHNAGRSQMAAALFNKLADPRKAKAISAGTHPAGHVHPYVIKVMSEAGLDLSKERPKKITKELMLTADFLVTMGCGEHCPHVSNLEHREWEISDTYESSVEKAREIRDEIRSQVEAFIKEKNF